MNLFPKKLMILGSGELGKEFAIAAQRLGCIVIACDKYENAPAMQVADKSVVMDMGNREILQETIRLNKPDAVIPEIEALEVEALKALEEEGINIIPTAKATSITMNRDQIRSLASEKLNVKTAGYQYAKNIYELKKAAEAIKYPLIIKPVMSSSGKGQSYVEKESELEKSWTSAIREARGKSELVIIEEFIKFDLEITLLTIRQKGGKTIFCDPIGHEQNNGDYQSSWQPQIIGKSELEEMKSIAMKVTSALGGVGLFGVEFFIRNGEVIFSELSPRPHDTGLVTLVSQNISEFELHLRAILELPIPEIKCIFPSASRVILSKDEFSNVGYKGIDKALGIAGTELLIFGKPTAKEGRRMGVCLATANSIDEAREKVDQSASLVEVISN